MLLLKNFKKKIIAAFSAAISKLLVAISKLSAHFQIRFTDRFHNCLPVFT